MPITVVALFTESDDAGQAVASLKDKGYTSDISVVSKDWDEDMPEAKDVKKNIADGTAAGVVTGAATGVLAVLLAGAAAVLLPGVGPLLITGPLAASWVAGGAAAGALAGGLIGALVDLGLPEEKARIFEEHILAGEVLVAVTTDEDHQLEVESLLRVHNAEELTTLKGI